MAKDRVRVWVVDDQPSFRRVTAAALSSMTDFAMTGVFDTGEAVVEHVHADTADLVLMDVFMPGIGGIEAARRVHAVRPELVIVLMSTYDVDELPTDLLTCGATSYLLKEKLNPNLLRQLWQSRP